MEDDHNCYYPDRDLPLTPGELRVLELISEKFSQDDIGDMLGIETNTLHALITGIVEKMDARSPSDAAMRALIAGLIGPYANSR